MNPTRILQHTDPERAIEFIPFGSADKIKLSIEIVQNMIAVPTKSGKTCSRREAVRFLMLCQAQRLNPFAGDAFLIGYDGQDGPTFSLIAAHQSFLKRAETCPAYEGMESGIILQGEDDSITERAGDFHLEDEHVVGGWARVFRKERKPTYRRIRMNRFNKGFAQWKVDAAGMIVKCAEADALRSTFPTLLGGLYMQGEMDGAAERIVSEIISTKPLFESESKTHADRLVRGILAAHSETATLITSEDDGGFGPQNSIALPPQSNAQPDPKSENPAGKPLLEPDQEALGNYMVEAGVSFDDFKDWLKASGRAAKQDLDSMSTIAELPATTAAAIRKDAKALATIVKLYGKGVGV